MKGRASLILTTWNTVEWLAMIVMITVNSDKFWFFLKLLSTTIQSRLESVHWSPVIIINNASTHSSRIIQEIIKNLHLQVKFGAAYWPEEAPVERAFGKLKSKLRALGGSMTIDFSKITVAELMFRLINSIGISSWIKAWIEVIREARKAIIEIIVKIIFNRELLPSKSKSHIRINGFL